MYRKQLARETLEYIKQGFYYLDGQKINFEKNQRDSEEKSILIKPEESTNVNNKVNNINNKIQYEITSEQTVEALFRLKDLKDIGILNFASAKNPGGGFLNGAKAQEESLAISSGLYLTLLKNKQYYQENRKCGNMIYTDYAIYSPNVVFIRDKNFKLVKYPIMASILTMPAVNMGQILLKTPELKQKAEESMKSRMRKILHIFASKGNKNLILGAYGCGVFRNNPVLISKYWHQLLKDEKIETNFENIVFAIYDTSSNKTIPNAFYNEFNYKSHN